MLEEQVRVRQYPGEPRRRLFRDDYLLLYFWIDDAQERVLGFELSYDLTGDCRALRWMGKHGVTHHAVDDGEGRTLRKATPILQPSGSELDPGILAEFRKRSGGLDPAVAAVVIQRLEEYLVGVPPSSR